MENVCRDKKKIETETISTSYFLAERQGFEPWEQSPVHRISSAAHSTTLASFLSIQMRCKGIIIFL